MDEGGHELKIPSSKKILLSVIGILILTAVPALAQEAVRKGGTFYVGLALPFNSFQGTYSRNVTTTRKGDVEVDSRMGWGELIVDPSRKSVHDELSGKGLNLIISFRFHIK